MVVFDSCPDGLSDVMVAQFRAEGYLAFEGLLTAAEVDAAAAAITELAARVDSLPDLLAQTEPGHQPDELDAEARLRKLMHWRAHHPVLAAIAEHGKLRSCVASLLGPAAICFQDMALIKPPRIGSEKPWHQDGAYFDVLPLEAVVGVWIALDRSTVDNGCMHVVPGAHRQGPRRHVMAPVLVPGGGADDPRRSDHTDCQLEVFDASGAVPIALAPGGVLLFSSLLPHQTPLNRSPHRRRALQLHYRACDSQRVHRAAYDRAFVDADGRPASCAAAGA